MRNACRNDQHAAVAELGQRALTRPGLRALDLDDRPTFSVVIIYQDPDTGRRAKCFYDKMTHEVGEECDFSLELWNFEMLAIPEMRDSSAQAAAQADFLVLSFHGNAELPAQTRYWIER